MVLVFLPDKTVSAAIHAAHDVEKHIRQEERLFCPGCGSSDLYFSRKSTNGSRWMEIEAKCGVCSTRFSLPDNVLQGFWRNGEVDKEIQPLSFTGCLQEEFVGECV